MGAPPRHHQAAHAARARRILEQAAPAGPEVLSFSLSIDGKAHGKGRPRFGRGRAYTPPATREHARRVQRAWREAGAPHLPPDAWYSISVRSYRRRHDTHYTTAGAISAYGRRRPYPDKPDVDNELKAILDALAACGAVPDDRRCVQVFALKAWDERIARGDEGDRVEVTVMAIHGGGV